MSLISGCADRRDRQRIAVRTGKKLPQRAPQPEEHKALRGLERLARLL
jgi:hypothetical protein